MFKHYEIRNTGVFDVGDGEQRYIEPLSEVALDRAEDPLVKTVWSLYGFTDDDLTEIICDRHAFSDAADMYSKLTGHPLLTEERDYFELPAAPRVVVEVEGGMVRAILATRPVDVVVVDFDDSEDEGIEAYLEERSLDLDYRDNLVYVW